MDLHADTSRLREGPLVFYGYAQPVNIQGYEPGPRSKNFCTISGALCYNKPYIGRTYHIMIQ